MESEPSVLVMFYAPWCGHCKRAKPHFVTAAAKMASRGIAGKLAAVDCTKHQQISKRFEVKGFPTIKYFKDGAMAFDAGDAREEASILKFMADPKEPPPPPPPEAPWKEEESDVVHLSEEDFKPFLKKKKHVLVMFYAPWCGHCKKAKPEITAAAAEFADDPKVSKIRFAFHDLLNESYFCLRLNWPQWTARRTTASVRLLKCPAFPPLNTSTTSTKSRRPMTGAGRRRTLWLSSPILSPRSLANLPLLLGRRSSGKACRGRYF